MHMLSQDLAWYILKSKQEPSFKLYQIILSVDINDNETHDTL